MKPRRREFIGAIRDYICKNTPVGSDEDTNKIIDKWRDGDDAEGPIENGVFGVCDHLANEIDKETE